MSKEFIQLLFCISFYSLVLLGIRYIISRYVFGHDRETIMKAIDDRGLFYKVRDSGVPNKERILDTKRVEKKIEE